VVSKPLQSALLLCSASDVFIVSAVTGRHLSLYNKYRQPPVHSAVLIIARNCEHQIVGILKVRIGQDPFFVRPFNKFFLWYEMKLGEMLATAPWWLLFVSG